MRLKDKVAIITGGSRGIGFETARTFLREGAAVILCGSREETAKKAVEELHAEFPQANVEGIWPNLTNYAEVKESFDRVAKEYGRIDILVNNSGTNCFREFTEFPDSEWQRVIELNMNAVYYLGHEVAKIMIKQGGGKIINIGSALSYTADAMCPAYVTAKHGVIGITRSFANELGKYNIQCNAVCPGFLATSVNSDVSDNKEYYDKITARIPADRWGRLDDLMGCMVFLASDASNYVNGADIKIDGGFSTTL